MKKLVLLAAFAGLISASAVANTKGDDKDKNKKECCKKGDAKTCSGDKKEDNAKDKKSCCKKDGEAKATATEEKK